MSPELVHTLKRHRGLLLGLAGAVTLSWAAYNGTRGIDDLLEKQEQIRQLQEQNAIIEAENQKRRERVERLQSSEDEQDIELRKLNLSKPGETIFMLPEGEKPKATEGKKSR